MTLTELLVSAALLAMMIVCLSKMLVPAYRAVRLAQKKIKADANIRAASTRLREDCSSIDTTGFLAILVDHYKYGTDTRDPAHPKPIYYPRYHLVMTTAGSFRSLYDGSVGANAARIQVGLSPEHDHFDDKGTPGEEGDDTTYWTLCRRAFLLDPACGQLGGGYYDLKADYEKSSAGWYHAGDPRDPNSGPMQELARFLHAESAPPRLWLHPDGGDPLFPVMTEQPQLNIPPTNVADIRALWPLLMSDIPMSEKVTGFKIQWTYGPVVESVGGVRTEVLKWHDVDNPHRASWASHHASDFDANSVAAAARWRSEFSLGTDPNGLPIYCALWSPANRANWPKAVRFLLAVGEKKEDSYEIIVDLPN